MTAWIKSLRKIKQLSNFLTFPDTSLLLLALFIQEHLQDTYSPIPFFKKKWGGAEILVTPHVVFICEKWTSCLWLNCLIACYQSSAAFKIYRIHQLLCHISCKGAGVGGKKRRRREFILRNNISNAATLTLHLVVLVAAVKLKYFTACVRNMQNGNYDRSD